MLSFLGRRQDARDVLAKAELIFPDDPMPRLIHTMILAEEGDLAGAEKLLDWARDHAHVSEEILTTWRSLVRLLARFHDMDTLILDQPGFGGKSSVFWGYATVLPEFFRVLSTLRKNIDPDRMSLDVSPLLAHWVGRLGPPLLRVMIFDVLHAGFDEAFRIFPTGWLALAEMSCSSSSSSSSSEVLRRVR